MRLAAKLPHDASVFAGDLHEAGIPFCTLRPVEQAYVLWLIRTRATRATSAAVCRGLYGNAVRNGYTRVARAGKTLRAQGIAVDDLKRAPRGRGRAHLAEPPTLASLRGLNMWHIPLFLEILGLPSGLTAQTIDDRAGIMWGEARTIAPKLTRLIGTGHINYEAGAWRAAPHHREEYLQWIQQQQQEQP